MPHKQHLALQRVGQCNHRGGSSNVAYDTKNLILLIELLHGFGGPSGLVAIVRRNEPKLPTVYSALCVSHVERSIDP